MSIKETPQRKPKEKQPTDPETQRGVLIQLCDLRETEALKKRGVAGYYFAVYPILIPDLEDSSMLLRKLSLGFLKKLEDEGLSEHSDTRIHIDNKAEISVDPAQGWRFSIAGYNDTTQTLTVRANHVDRDDAQRMVITALVKYNKSFLSLRR